MKYMLDTNIIIYARNARPQNVLEQFRKYSPEDFCISAITMAELEYGISNSCDPARNRIALAAFLAGIEVLPFGAEAALEYGSIRAVLKKKGHTIGANDLLIAAHARSLNLPLVTHNTREFQRVEGLVVEDWF